MTDSSPAQQSLDEFAETLLAEDVDAKDEERVRFKPGGAAALRKRIIASEGATDFVPSIMALVMMAAGIELDANSPKTAAEFFQAVATALHQLGDDELAEAVRELAPDSLATAADPMSGAFASPGGGGVQLRRKPGSKL